MGTNEAGAVVPCASPVAVGSGVYNFADAPVGLHPVVGAAPAAPAAAEGDAVVSVEKREAEAEADPEAEAAADAWYGYYGGWGGYGYYGLGHGYYGGVGCRNGYGAAVPCALGKKKSEIYTFFFREITISRLSSFNDFFPDIMNLFAGMAQ